MTTWQEKFDLTRRLNDAMNRSATSKDGQRAANVVVKLLDEKDATIARLTRALTAGVDALRVDPRDGEPWGPYKEMLVTHAIKVVEAAQREAMEEE